MNANVSNNINKASNQRFTLKPDSKANY